MEREVKNYNTMPELTKQLTIEVLDGHFPLESFLFHVTHLRRRDEVLIWCIKNKLVGKKLHEAIINDFSGSLLKTSKYILGRLEHFEKQSILVGRDYIPD